jgi:hypothetical protein
MEVLNANIGGVYFWVWLLGIPAFYGVFFLFNSWWETRKAIEKCSGNNILALFHTVGGQAYFKWCKDEQGELSPADMKGYDKDARSLAPKAIAKIRAAKQDFGWYAVLPDHVFGIPFPLGSKNPKAIARLIEYVENYPMPMVTADLKKWNDQQYALVCSAMAGASKDTGDIRAIISEAAGIEEKLGAMADIPEQIRSLKLFIYGIAGGVAILILMVYMYGDKLGKLASQYGISLLQTFGFIGG